MLPSSSLESAVAGSQQWSETHFATPHSAFFPADDLFQAITRIPRAEQSMDEPSEKREPPGALHLEVGKG